MVGLAVSRRVAPTILAIAPSLPTAPSRSGDVQSKEYPVSSATASRNCSTASVITIGNWWRPRRAAAPAAAPRQPHPHHGLFGGLDQVQRALAAVLSRHRQRETAHLANRLGDALEQ